jgi:hypothetical protein
MCVTPSREGRSRDAVTRCFQVVVFGPYRKRVLDLGRIDVDEIATALADQTDFEHRWLIDPRAGQVAFWTSDTGIDGQNPLDIDEIDLILIDPLPPSVWFQDMADFANDISDAIARRKLTQALQGRRAFRRFKNQLYEHHQDLISPWHSLRDVRAQRRAVEWRHYRRRTEDYRSARWWLPSAGRRRTSPDPPSTANSGHIRRLPGSGSDCCRGRFTTWHHPREGCARPAGTPPGQRRWLAHLAPRPHHPSPAEDSVEGLSLDRAGRETGDDLALKDGVDDQLRNQHQGRGRHHGAVVDRVLPLEP